MDDCKCIDRRSFLRFGGMTLVISALNPSFKAFADSRLRPLREQSASGKTFIYIFQRFGADGLNTAVPIEPGELAIYQSYRPTLGLTLGNLTPQQLTPDWALHPAAASLATMYNQDGNVAVMPNVGYPNGSRSHFDSQKFLDNGTPFDKTTADGWLNRYVQANPIPGAPLRAISFSTSLPFSLYGSGSALAFSNLAALSVSPNAARDQKYLDLQAQIYALPTPGREYDPELAETGTSLVNAINVIRATSLPAPTVPFPAGTFGTSLSQLSQLIRSDAFEIELAEVDLGGWDHHTQQGGGASGPLTGQFPGLLLQLSDGIKALVDDLGPARMANTVILTVSEFGRTANENGNRGTDHGSAWTSFAVGGGVRGGVHFGPGGWYSLADLRDNRDLKYSLDYRDVFSEVLSRHLGNLTPEIFPGWTYSPVGIL